MDLKDELSDAFDKLKKEANVLAGKEGKDKEYHSEKDYGSKEKVSEMFESAKVRLFDVNKWSDIPIPGLAAFTVYNREELSVKIDRIAVGDYVKIELPGPVPENWVKVIDLYEDDMMAWFTVRPSDDPIRQSGKTQHFFTSEATSTFKVERAGTKVVAYEIGRNEVINKTDEEAGDRKLINTLVAEGGWLGYQSFQWNKLTDYLVGNLD